MTTENASPGPGDVGNLLTEFELSLVTALQFAPRAPFALLGQVLGCSDRTAARRWDDLQERGVVWPRAEWHGAGTDTLVSALISVDTAGRDDYELFAEVAEMPEVLTIEKTLHGADAILLVRALSVHDLGVRVLPAIRTVPGVVATRTVLVTRVLFTSLDWRFGALTPRQVEQLERASKRAKHRPTVRERDMAVIHEVLRKPRARVSDIARATGVGNDAVTAIIEGARRSGALKMGVEVDTRLLGYEAECLFTLRMNPDDIHTLKRMLHGLGLLRFLVTTAGVVNVMLGIFIRTMEDVALVDEVIRSTVRGVDVVSTQITFGTTKRGGWIQVDHGFAPERFVPPPI